MIKLFIATLLLSISVGAQSLGGSVLTVEPSDSIIFRDEVSAESMSKLSNELLEKHLARKNVNSPIYLFIDSPGGSISAGQDFIDFASTIPNVVTVNQFAASMAAGIIQALPGRRLVTATSTLMFHRASGGLKGQFEDGELESRLFYYKKIVRGMEIVNSMRLQISLETYKSLVKDEYWLYGKEIVEKHGADKLITLKCSKAALTSFKVFDTVIDMGFIQLPLKVKMSNCPLLRNAEYLGSPDQKAVQQFENRVIKRNME